MSGKDQPGGGRSAFLAYNAVLAAASPLLAGWYGWRVLGSGKSREGWLERLGLPAESQKGLCRRRNVWVHAVSVGEVVAASPVVRHLRQLPEAPDVELTTITSTGHRMAEKVLPGTPAFFLPVDVLPAVRAVMSRVQPLCLALCEAELWPNLLNEAQRTGAKVALINGRVTEHTLRTAERHGWIFRWALSNIDRFLMQSAEDAERVVTLGADERRVEVAGNTKFDEADEPLPGAERTELSGRYGLPAGAPVFVAGSTNPGEDEVALDAFCAARRVNPDLRMIIAPRQIERAEDIVRLAADRGLTAVRRTAVAGPHNRDVVVLDTFGELAKVYALALVSFVGGTFVDKGGHNILQPLAQGVPVAFGPYDYKIRDIADKALKAGVAVRAQTPEALASAVSELATGIRRADYHTRALGLIAQNRGASACCAQAIYDLARQALTLRGGRTGGQ